MLKNYKDIAKAIKAKCANIPNKEDRKFIRKYSEPFVNATFETIAKFLSEGHEVRIVGFGTFYLDIQNERKIHHPVTQEVIIVPPRYDVRFRASEKITDIIRKLPVPEDNKNGR